MKSTNISHFIPELFQVLILSSGKIVFHFIVANPVEKGSCWFSYLAIIEPGRAALFQIGKEYPLAYPSQQSGMRDVNQMLNVSWVYAEQGSRDGVYAVWRQTKLICGLNFARFGSVPLSPFLYRTHEAKPSVKNPALLWRFQFPIENVIGIKLNLIAKILQRES